jgi:hypothetical protein
VRFRAIWLIHNPFATCTMPAISTFRPRRQLNEEEHNKPLQPPPGPYFHGEEIRGRNQVRMPAQKIPSRRLAASLR